MTANGSALLRNAMIVSVPKQIQVIIKYSRILKNTRTQQENTKENTKKTTEINWDWSKKISWLVLVKTCEMSLLLMSRFWNANKKVKTLLKGEEILLLIRKFYRKIGRKLIISYSNKMQPLGTKCFKSVTSSSCWFLKKREPSKKHTKTS